MQSSLGRGQATQCLGPSHLMHVALCPRKSGDWRVWPPLSTTWPAAEHSVVLCSPVSITLPQLQSEVCPSSPVGVSNHLWPSLRDMQSPRWPCCTLAWAQPDWSYPTPHLHCQMHIGCPAALLSRFFPSIIQQLRVEMHCLGQERNSGQRLFHLSK